MLHHAEYSDFNDLHAQLVTVDGRRPAIRRRRPDYSVKVYDTQRFGVKFGVTMSFYTRKSTRTENRRAHRSASRPAAFGSSVAEPILGVRVDDDGFIDAMNTKHSDISPEDLVVWGISKILCYPHVRFEIITKNVRAPRRSETKRIFRCVRNTFSNSENAPNRSRRTLNSTDFTPGHTWNRNYIFLSRLRVKKKKIRLILWPFYQFIELHSESFVWLQLFIVVFGIT